MKKVSHKDMGFARPNNPSRKGEAETRGTQIADRQWRSVDDYIPISWKAKKNGDVNDHLSTYLYSWVWRTWLPADADMELELGKLCSRHNELGWSADRSCILVESA